MRINPQLLLHSTLLMLVAGCAGPGPTPTAGVPATRETAAAIPAVQPPVAEAVTPPTTRPAVVTLRFNASSIDAIIAGTKTSTCRKGVREFPANVAIGTDGKRKLNLVILSATTKRFGDLSADDAQSDGSGTVGGLKQSLQTAYPGIADDDVLTVVKFKIAQ